MSEKFLEVIEGDNKTFIVIILIFPINFMIVLMNIFFLIPNEIKTLLKKFY